MLSKIRNASSVRNSSATRIAGLISGMMTLEQPLPVAPAPSTWAALSRSWGTSANPASSSSAMNGVVFHTSARTTMRQRRELFGQRRAAVGQQVGQITRARRPRVIPAVGRCDGDDSVRDQDRGAHDALAEDGPVHHHRQRQAEHELDRHRNDGDHQGDHERRPPIPVGEHRDVVLDARRTTCRRAGRGCIAAGSARPRNRSDTP